MRIFHRENHFHPVIQVARHQIRAPDQHLVLSTVTKVVDSRMFQKTSNYRGDGDGLADPRNTRPQTTNTPHLKVNPDSGLRRSVQGLDAPRIDQRVHLEGDISIIVLAVAARLALDPIKQLLPERCRCNE